MIDRTYQSVFGPGAWLTPATIDRMAELPTEGLKDVLLVAPGFVIVDSHQSDWTG